MVSISKNKWNERSKGKRSNIVCKARKGRIWRTIDREQRKKIICEMKKVARLAIEDEQVRETLTIETIQSTRVDSEHAIVCVFVETGKRILEERRIPVFWMLSNWRQPRQYPYDKVEHHYTVWESGETVAPYQRVERNKADGIQTLRELQVQQCIPENVQWVGGEMRQSSTQEVKKEKKYVRGRHCANSPIQRAII